MANNDYITTDCKLTVSKNTAKLDEEIFLYKNDRNIKLLIEIVDNKYRYKSDDLSNLLVKYKASYAQVKWYKNAEVKKEFPIQATDDGKVVFVIEGQLIDEDTELGDYDLQLRLLNESQESIRSLPIIKGAVHILKPLFEEGDIATVNSAIADVSMLSLDGDAIDTYNSDGTYNQTNWGNGDVISSAKLNKLEKVAKDNVDKVNKMPAKSIVEGGKIYLAKEDGTKLDSGTELPAGGTGTSYDDTEIKTDINTIKTDLGTETLNTTAKDIKGGINEVAAQYKDIAKKNDYFINIKSFGVKGDNLTDDTESFQKALNYGGNLYIPEGIYLINGELKFKSNTHLKGVLKKTIIKAKSAKYTRKSDNSERWNCLALIGNYGIEKSYENIILENIIFDGNSGRSNNQYIDASYGDDKVGSKLIEVINSNHIELKNVIVQNNNYAGSSFISCQNICIDNFKSLNCDVGILIDKDKNTNTELKNYTFSNIFIDGHDMSEGISFYNKSYVENVKLKNITILNKEKGTSLMLGTEYEGEYGVINCQVENVTIKNSAIGISINEYSKNIQISNIIIDTCKRGLLISNNSNSNQISNIILNNIKTHGIYIGTNSYNNLLSNVFLYNCNTLKSTDINASYIYISGTKNIIKNIVIKDDDNLADKLVVSILGRNNLLTFDDIQTEAPYLKAILKSGSSYNTIKSNSSKCIRFTDENINYLTVSNNKLEIVYDGIYEKGLTTNDVNLHDTILNRFKFSLTSANTIINLQNISLFEELKTLYITITVPENAINSKINLSSEGNIIWKSNDTISPGNTVMIELICLNNKWVEKNRLSI